MGMEIKISAGDMLKVLVHAGIEATDAKAIIFDLLQYPDGNIPERSKLKAVKKQRLKKRRVEIIEDDEDDGEEDDDEEEEEDDGDEEETEDDLLATRIRKSKRVNFKGFGGSGITPVPGQSVKRG